MVYINFDYKFVRNALVGILPNFSMDGHQANNDNDARILQAAVDSVAVTFPLYFIWFFMHANQKC